MNKPMITVLMSVYNGEKYLKEAIDSILTQTFEDFEFLIINDGSTDSSVEIIEAYDDPRIRLVNNEKNLKLIASLNKGISLARGKYIARMDSDDVSMPERFEKEVKFLEGNPDYGLVGTYYSVIDGVGNEKYKMSYPSNNDLIKLFLSVNCPLVHGSIMGRTELFRQNLYGSKEFSAIEDYELWVRMSKVTKIHNIPEYLFKYRIYGESFSDTKAKLMADQTLGLSKKLYRENKKIYKELAQKQILSGLYVQEKEAAVEYIHKWLFSFFKRFVYVCDFWFALKLYIKAVKENKRII